MDTLLSKKGSVIRIYYPPDANSLLCVAEHCFQSTNYINVLIIDKQPQFQYLTIDQAREQCGIGAAQWKWASNEAKDGPEIILASAGDIVTMETVAAAHWLREKCPELSYRVVNVVDLMAICTPEAHPHGMKPDKFTELFTDSCDVVFSFHGYPGGVHQVLHHRPNPTRFHVKGYKETGTTTTPFSMLVLNRASRFNIAREALVRSKNPAVIAKRDGLIAEIAAIFAKHEQYTRENFEDLPEIQNWKWTPKQN